jgi:hypothetical protein
MSLCYSGLEEFVFENSDQNDQSQASTSQLDLGYFASPLSLVQRRRSHPRDVPLQFSDLRLEKQVSPLIRSHSPSTEAFLMSWSPLYSLDFGFNFQSPLSELDTSFHGSTGQSLSSELKGENEFEDKFNHDNLQ